jgi:hypothetical protein
MENGGRDNKRQSQEGLKLGTTLSEIIMTCPLTDTLEYPEPQTWYPDITGGQV